jgi:hypothetical protein
MTSTNQSKLDYFMDVLLRNYCRVLEENDVIYEELDEVHAALAILFRENAAMREQLTAMGVRVEPSSFIPEEQLAEIETLAKL